MATQECHPHGTQMRTILTLLPRIRTVMDNRRSLTLAVAGSQTLPRMADAAAVAA